MPNYDFFSYVLSPGFLIPMALVLAAFLPLAYSVYVTWEENKHKAHNLQQRIREERRSRRTNRVGS